MTESVSLCIRALAHGGAGIGHLDGIAEGPASPKDERVWFVPGTLVGERVIARPLRERKKYVHAQLVNVLESSPHRVRPVCEVVDQCGGCGWMHIDPLQQANYKAEIVLGQLRHFVKNIDQVFLSPKPVHYRRRARIHYKQEHGKTAFGFYQNKNHQLVDIPHCEVLEPALNHAFMRVRQLAEFLPQEGEIHGLSAAGTSICGLPGLTLSEELRQVAEKLLDDVFVGLSFRSGRKQMVVGRGRLAIDADQEQGWPAIESDPFAFAQAQSSLNEALVRYVCSQIEKKKRDVLELFCGSGNFTRALATVSKNIWAWDQNGAAIENLEGIRKAGFPNLIPRHGSADRALEKYSREKKRFVQAIVDPPRSGLEQGLAKKLASIVDSQVIYVSCDPATLARDAKVLQAEGFDVQRVAVFDMMPMTSEVEVVVSFQRQPRHPSLK